MILLIIKACHDKFMLSRLSGLILVALDYIVKKKTCTMFKPTDHSMASFFMSNIFAGLSIPIWIYIEVSVFLYRMGRKRTVQDLRENRFTNFLKRKIVFLIWIPLTITLGYAWVYLVAYTSCRNIDVTLMEPHGFPKNDGECQYLKTDICYHELFQSIDWLLYSDPGSCDNKKYDFMESSEVREMMEKTKPGSTIAAWPLWDSYKKYGYEFPTYLYGLFFF